MSNELEPCPFCGEEAFKKNMAMGSYVLIECGSCKAKGPDSMSDDHAIDAWNTRTSLEDELTYQQAKKAVELFESEYVGQDQSELWSWAINEVFQGVDK